MGRKSTKEEKNIYFTSREKAGLTREQAAEKLFISEDRIAKIEYGTSSPHPDEVILMSRCYKNSLLCNHFCAHECEIGQETVPEIKAKDLSQITLEMLNNLQTMQKEKERLIEITVDGEISKDEMENFKRIQDRLNQMSITIETLRLWADSAVATGRIKE